MRGKMNHLLENRNLLHLALHEAVSESKGRSRESIGDGRLGTLVVIVRQAVLGGAQVVFLRRSPIFGTLLCLSLCLVAVSLHWVDPVAWLFLGSV